MGRYEVDERKQDADAQEQVPHGEYLAEISVGVEVSISDCRKRNNAKIERIEPVPTFDVMVKERSDCQ